MNLLSLGLVAALGVTPWFLTDPEVETAHQQGLTGEGVVVALVDTPVAMNLPQFSEAHLVGLDNQMCAIPAEGSDLEPYQVNHGTAMANLLVGEGGLIPEATLVVAPYGTGDKEGFFTCDHSYLLNDSLGTAINNALDAGAQIIAIPSIHTEPGGVTEGSLLEAAFLRALEEEVILVFPRDNSQDLPILGSSEPSFQQYFPGFFTVNSFTESGELSPYSPVNDPGVELLVPTGGINFLTPQGQLTEFRAGGNSAGTLVTAGYLGFLKEQWPEAKGNQLIQLVETTKNLKTFDLEEALATDPRDLPETNPLLEKDLRNAQEWSHPWESLVPTTTVPGTVTTSEAVAQDPPGRSYSGLIVVVIFSSLLGLNLAIKKSPRT